LLESHHLQLTCDDFIDPSIRTGASVQWRLLFPIEPATLTLLFRSDLFVNVVMQMITQKNPKAKESATMRSLTQPKERPLSKLIAAQPSSGSSWTQKKQDSPFKELSNGIKFNQIRF